MAAMPQKYLALCICLTLAMLVCAVFAQLLSAGFINYDDPAYVTQNPHVQNGLTPRSLVWAFTATCAGNWHPLTWLSHMLDCRLFDLNSGLHHLTNLLLHLANTLLLFWLLNTMTARPWQSAFVAALFALHPLHVESVAWIAERKDLLSAFFGLLALAAYIAYAKSRKSTPYLLTIVLFALALMAKPMLVTLPFVLLLLDFWPLGRLQKSSRVFYRLLIEKLPFFILSACACIITFLVQKSAGAVAKVDLLPLKICIANAFVAYLTYVAKMFWPVRLAVLYPHPGESLPLWKPIVSLLILLAVTVIIICFMAKYKYLFTGWFWFLGTLVPVIGIIQVGTQSHADRYTYLPLIGLFIMFAWGLPDLLSNWRYKKSALGASAVAVILALSIASFNQTRLWQNSFTLYTHTLKVTRPNSNIHVNLGSYLQAKGRLDDAISNYRAAIEIKPSNSEALYNLATVLAEQKNFQQAENYYRRALEFNPNHANAHYNLALLLKSQGKLDEAVTHLQMAIQAKPDFAEAHNNLANIFAAKGLFDKAIPHYQKALEINPNYTQARLNLETAIQSMKNSP